MLTLLRTLIWLRHEPAGAEYFGLWRDGSGWQLRGTVIVALDGVPARVRYGVSCDAGWRTTAVHVALRGGAEEQALHLTADGTGRWESRSRDLVDIRGCLDVDLEITPSTNTLPIRRLTLAPGASAAVTAAWIRFPSLAVEPLDQTYSRLDTNRYRYASGTEFTAPLEVDDLGLVTHYGDLWERTGTQDMVGPE